MKMVQSQKLMIYVTLAEKYSLKIISIQDIVNLLDDDVLNVSMPTKHGEFKMYQFKGLNTDFTAMSFGNLKVPSPLLRIHSECFTGDVFGSLGVTVEFN